MKILFMASFLLSTSPLMAQFDKYKSKTKFEPKANPSNGAAKPSFVDRSKQVADKKKVSISKAGETNKKDNFGRLDKVNKAPKETRDKKYVNLNPETAFGPEVVTSFDFQDTPLMELTKHMQKLTGLNLIIDKEMKGKVTISASSPITVGDAWKAYLTALNLYNYSLVKSGAFYKVVQTRNIKQTPTKIYTGNYTPETDNYVMRIIPLKNVSSSEVKRNFQQFSSKYGRIAEIKQTNTIVALDTGTNINRLVRLIKFIDVEGHEESLQIIPMKHSSASEIAKLLDSILKGQGSSSSSRLRSSRSKKDSQDISKIIAEPRTNTIIAMANSQGAKQLRGLIKKLDVKQSSNSNGQIHVYYLKNGDAEALAKTLSTLTSSSSNRSSSRSRRTSRLSTSNQTSLFSAAIKVTADKDNNALVITASPTDYLTIQDVITKLDIPKDQVYVEGLMMETQVGKLREFGINILGAYGSGAAQRVGTAPGGTDGLVNLLTNNITNLGGLFGGFGIGKAIEIPNPAGGDPLKINSINGLVKAIAADTSTNVLATPQILAYDNTEAVFESAENVPVPTTTSNNTSTSSSLVDKKVGLTLSITPQINKVTRFVKLKIDQKIEDFSNRPVPAELQGQGVGTVVRQAKTTVVVRDRDTIAMGGLMRDKEDITHSKVPLLGDIPVLGWLFKNKKRQVSKVNLLLFLTPRILANYQNESSGIVKDLLNRRNAHLKKTIGEEDPFKTTAKGLYDKATQQAEGPLFDEKERSEYSENTVIENAPDETYPPQSNFSNDDDIPDYKTIIEKVRLRQAGPKR